MIAYIKGNITLKTPTYVYVETAGVGYQINISLHTYAKIEKSENVKLLTHFHVKEDSQTLYGFADDAERSLFVLLISVSGIGPSTAQVVLSSLNPDEVKSAIVSENVDAFKKVKGIGPKTAKRVILDLKDKILKAGGGELNLPVTAAVDNTIRTEAIGALQALGFNKIMVQKALNKILREQPNINTVEALIKEALKQL